jgi:thiol-disulfide isomerase/thioredoxin
MQSDELLDTLVGTGVLEPTTGGESVAVTAEFQESVEETETTLERRESLREELEARFDEPDALDALAALGEDDQRFVAQYCALAERVESLSHDDLVRTVAVLAQFQGTPPRSAGVPDPFLPVQGEQLPTLLGLTRRAVVYVWQEDCEPCDLVRGTLEDLLDAPEDIALFAVYGPDWAELLYEEFDVAGAPTTLFVLDGEVDSRLNGPHYPESYEGELETLRELA